MQVRHAAAVSTALIANLFGYGAAHAAATSSADVQATGNQQSASIQSAPTTQSAQGIARAQPQARDDASVTNAQQQQEVVVTGSRIARPNLAQPTPIQTLSPEQIQNAGTGNLGDIITQLPAVGFTSGVRGNSNNFGNGAGLNELNLRNLGTSRTLVLVDGQRHVASDINSNAVDINTIPTALVDHVEVVTGGASAIYGSDAVTGVVNIILKKNFEGLEMQAEGGGFDNGFGQKYSSYGTFGKNFLDGRLNLTATGYWTREEGIDARNVPTAHNYGTITNPNDLSGPIDPTFYTSPSPIRGDGKPDTLFVQNVGSDYVTRGGVLLDANTFNPIADFDAAGNLVPVTKRLGYNSFAFAQLPSNCGSVTCYFTEDYEQISSPLETYGADVTGHYDATSHLHVSLDAKFARSITDNVIQPSFSFGTYQLQPDNAFITPALRNGPLAGLDAADYPFISKFLNDGRVNEATRDTYRVVLGFSGDFDAKIAQVNWDGALNYGRTVERYDNSHLVITQNFAAALDSVINPATGQAACRVNVPSAAAGGLAYGETPFNPTACVPYNPFGTQNGAAVQNYISGDFITRDHLSQQVANLNASADTSRFFKLQGGPLQFAVGSEYRMERTYETNDPFVIAGNTENLASNSAGGFNVYEGYIEANAPVFKHFAPGLDEFTVDAAYRGSYYSTVGHTDAYKFSSIYGPFSDIKFRGTYSRAVRAPNITEAFLPASSGYFNVVDPCDLSNIGSNVNYAKNCAAAGVPANFTANTNASIIGTTSGNPHLDPEKSISYTGGVVLTPRWTPHLSVTLDYYAIKIKNAITNVSAQDIINNCYNGATLDPQYCSLFTRGADNNINFVSTTYVNASKLETDGIDLETNYFFNVAGLTSRFKPTSFLDGRLSATLTANYVIHLRNFPFQNIPSQVQIEELTANSPRLRGLAGLTYEQGPVQVSWSTRYLGRTVNFSRDSTSADHSETNDIPYNKQVFYHNLVIRYKLPGQLKGLELFGGVNDLFDDRPPGYLLGAAAGVGGTADNGYDLGRYIFGGLKLRL